MTSTTEGEDPDALLEAMGIEDLDALIDSYPTNGSGEPVPVGEPDEPLHIPSPVVPDVSADEFPVRWVGVSAGRIYALARSPAREDTKALLSALDVVPGEQGSARMERTGNLVILRSNPDRPGEFGHVLDRAEALLEARPELRPPVPQGLVGVVEIGRRHGFDGFCRAAFEPIIGNRPVKEAVSAGMFSSKREPVHVLGMGSPAAGKTFMTEFLMKNFGNVVSAGANSTRAGLVYNLSTKEPGLLADADGKVVILDEMDKIPKKQLAYCYELMANGHCTIAGNVQVRVDSEFVLIAWANPSGGEFKSQDVAGQIDMRPELVSRFALVARMKRLEAGELEKLVREQIQDDQGIPRLDPRFDAWLQIGRQFEPELVASEEAVDRFVDASVALVEEYVDHPLQRDARVASYMRRIAKSIARAEFCNVDDKVLDRALRLMREVLGTWEA